jgi:toxin CcdB
MARYDIHANPNGGYLLDVQADILDQLNTRVVVPLLPADEAPPPAARLNPVFDLDGGRFVMVTQYLAAVPLALLKKPEGNLSADHDRIVAALDMVFQGF